MNDSALTVFYIMMILLPQVLTSALGFVLCRKPAKNILSAVLNKKRRNPIAADVWDRANVKAGRFLCLGGLVCIVLSADFCAVAASLGWHVSAPALALTVPYGLFIALLAGAAVYAYIDNKKTFKKLRFPAKKQPAE